MLHDNKTETRRVSAKQKAADDVHDLWDVQAALKRLVDGCNSFVENTPDRQDFYDDAECPLCLPAGSSRASVTSSNQVLPRIKTEPVDIRLSLLSYHPPF